MVRINHFTEKANPSSLKSQRSADRVRRTEREDLEKVLPRAHRAARKKSIVQGHRNIATIHAQLGNLTGQT
jgi:hypothetical protein